jgi:hypothetical protein
MVNKDDRGGGGASGFCGTGFFAGGVFFWAAADLASTKAKPPRRPNANNRAGQRRFEALSAKQGWFIKQLQLPRCQSISLFLL